MSKKKRTNPRNIPRTQADCDREWRVGCIEGMRVAEAIFMSVLKDKHGHEIDLLKVWDEIVAMTEAMDKGYVSVADMRQTLKEEYDIELTGGPSRAIEGDKR